MHQPQAGYAGQAETDHWEAARLGALHIIDLEPIGTKLLFQHGLSL